MQSETLYSKLVCLLVIGMTYCASIQVCVPCSSLKKKKTHIKVKDQKISILCDIFKKTFFFSEKYTSLHLLYIEKISLQVLVAQLVKNLLAMQETQVRSPDQKDPLEKGMATHSSILAWRIPWTQEPDGLQSVGSQKSDTTEGLTLSLSLNIRFTGFHFAPAVYLFNLCLIAEMVHFGCFFFSFAYFLILIYFIQA